MGVARGEVGFGEGETEVDGGPSEAAGVGEEDAGFAFGDGLREIAEMAVEFGSGVEAAELELGLFGSIGEHPRVLKVLGGLGRIFGQEEPGEDDVTAAKSSAEVVPDIRKVIYTTNAIESLNMSLRKVIKTRGSFPNPEAALKLLYLALEHIAKKWTMPVQNWKAALQRFAILLGERVPKGEMM